MSKSDQFISWRSIG